MNGRAADMRGKKEEEEKKSALDGSEDVMDGLTVQVSASVSPQVSEKSD